jgi:hypothetical protein
MTEPAQVQGMKVFRYKLDFYYQQALLYLLTLLLYGGVRGTMVFERMPTLTSDPILYIIGVFVVISFIVLMLNKTRDRKLMIGAEEIVFHNKFHERRVQIADIEWLYIGKERSVRTAGRSQVIVFKVNGRRRWFRIRVGRYEHEMELIQEIERIGGRVPKAKRPMFGVRQSKF